MIGSSVTNRGVSEASAFEGWAEVCQEEESEGEPFL